jgi:hypothetical protein
MSIDIDRQSMTQATRADGEVIQFRLIYAICFSLFLLAAIVQRLLPWTWSARSPHAGSRRSVLEQARNAAGICATYAFMA